MQLVLLAAFVPSLKIRKVQPLSVEGLLNAEQVA